MKMAVSNQSLFKDLLPLLPDFKQATQRKLFLVTIFFEVHQDEKVYCSIIKLTAFGANLELYYTKFLNYLNKVNFKNN